MALSNGVMPGNYPCPQHPAGFTGDWTYTHVQHLDPAGGEGRADLGGMLGWAAPHREPFREVTLTQP